MRAWPAEPPIAAPGTTRRQWRLRTTRPEAYPAACRTMHPAIRQPSSAVSFKENVRRRRAGAKPQKGGAKMDLKQFVALATLLAASTGGLAGCNTTADT